MNLIRAIIKARRLSRQSCKEIYVLHDGRTWRACDECDVDTKYRDAPIAYCAYKRKD